MAESSKIEWTDHTFNPWIGCTKVHAGCANCYAERDFAIRRKRVVWGGAGTRSRTSDDNWRLPEKWHKQACMQGRRPRVFCASLADVFEDWNGPILNHRQQRLFKSFLPNCEGQYNAAGLGPPATMDDLRRDLFRLIDVTPNLDWLLLTKRPENIRRMLPQVTHEVVRDGQVEGELTRTFWPNVWLLTSVSDRATYHQMVPPLRDCRDLVPVLGISYEPALGPLGDVNLSGIDWLISGHESGPNRRPGAADDIRSAMQQCQPAGVAFFNKQMHIDGRVEHDVEKFPPDLRGRKWPEASDGSTTPVGSGRSERLRRCWGSAKRG